MSGFAARQRIKELGRVERREVNVRQGDNNSGTGPIDIASRDSWRTRVISYRALGVPRQKPEGDDVTNQTPTRTLQDVLDSVPNLVDHLYSNRKPRDRS